MRGLLWYGSAGLVLLLLLIADALGKGELTLNAFVLGTLGVTLVSGNLKGAFKHHNWFPRKRRADKSIGADFVLMEARVRRAATGRQSSRRDIATLLASAYAMRTTSSLRPSGDSVRRATEDLVAKAGADRVMAEVFNPGSEAGVHAILDAKRNASYLNALQDALNLVTESS